MVKKTDISVPTDTTTQSDLNTLEAIVIIERLVAIVRETCSLLINEAQPICVTAKAGACEAIENSIHPKTESYDAIIELVGKEDLDFLGCC